MNLPRPHVRALGAAVTSGLLLLGMAGTAAAGGAHDSHGGGHGHHRDNSPQLEDLDRGLVAVSTSEGVFLSWRLLGTEAGSATESGVSGPAFAVFRDGKRVATVDGATSYVDRDGDNDAVYSVAPAWNDVVGERSAEASPWTEGYLDVELTKPADGVTPPSTMFPEGEQYTYSANDASVGDVDGDGALELVVKWDPSNSKDVSQKGYTGTVYVDTYELDGTLLNRIDLGVNIRAGAHYAQVVTYDFDGDGRAETMLKTAPGTKSITYGADGEVVDENFISMPRSDVRAGYSHDDDYRMSAADYREHLIGMFQDWTDRPEVRSGQWPATLEEAWGIPTEHAYPLSQEDAGELADYFIDTWAPARSSRNDLTTFDGFIVDGPEYLTVFDGATGEELDTVRYEPGRGDDGLLWGDYAYSRIEPGNRVDRFLAGVAYLDGDEPTAIFARGYYTRATVAAYDWDGKKIRQRWMADSGHVPMSNPFNDSPHGREGTDSEYATLTTQGFHSLSAADVDGDGRQEIVYGSATLDDDGSLLYSSYDTLPEGSADPGAEAKLGHGDAMHVTDIDPSRDGLEIWSVHEGGAGAPYGSVLRDAATGEVLHGAYSGRDTGRGMIGDVRADVPGIELWASMPGGSDGSGLLDVAGNQIDASTPGTNQSIRWAGDLTTQLVNGAQTDTYTVPTIDDWTRGTLLTADGTSVNNWTKGNPALVADILGDWREELVTRTLDSSAMRIYVSTEETEHQLPTLLHDLQYRVEVARQNTSYNQPSYTSYYLASDMDFSDVPVATEDHAPREPRLAKRHDRVTIPADRHFTYYVNGDQARAGSHRVTGSAVTVTAEPKQGVAISAGADWTWEFDLGSK
ncbi:rhamnogalacturonan lyase [Demequina sp. NBRC 110057]|uniref:rhamnogalacturonan lyase n=1 Tax=Demequina sp. NBRC 110057 TaxID=1570346 RepID=UPI000A07133C|nr:rhamnogalacturonan lyase [Demequina sp. NBRC 110057]